MTARASDDEDGGVLDRSGCDRCGGVGVEIGPLFLEYADETGVTVTVGVAVGDRREDGRWFMGVGEDVLGPRNRSVGPLTRSPLDRSRSVGLGHVNRSANRSVQRDSSWQVCDGDKVAMNVV